MGTIRSFSAAASAPAAPPYKETRWGPLLAAGIIASAALAAYHNSFHAPFFFDDPIAITENPTIRHLWPPWPALTPPTNGSGVTGRPLVNLSLALNYAFGGTAVEGYHAVNLALHVLAGLTLFGLIRRTLRRPVMQLQFGRAATTLALVAALCWTLHPLQTETVTCVIQRTELLVGLFYLLTLYCFVRGAESARPGRWYALAAVACLLGMASKEVMVSAPLMVLLYDRTFVAGSFAAAWSRRRKFHLALAGTWGLLASLILSTGGSRGSAAGFGLGITSWNFALTQFQAMVHYVRLALWPYPLIVDYGADVVTNVGAVAPQATVVLLLVAGTAVAVIRRPAIGFLGAWFFAILAPSSSVVPLVAQTVAEHRMYLPLAAVIVLAVAGVFYIVTQRAATWGFLAVAVALGFTTARRNEDYRSEVAIWSATVLNRPQNPRAQVLLGAALARAGHPEEAVARYREAVRLHPNFPEAHAGLGEALLKSGQIAAAMEESAVAVRLKPALAEAHSNLGSALYQAGRVAEGRAQLEMALRLQPDLAEAQVNLAGVLLQTGHAAEAASHSETALRLKPDWATAHYNLGNALLALGRPAEAVPHFEAALRTEPDSAEAQANLAGALYQLQRPVEAIAHYEIVLRLRPDNAEAHFNLAGALLVAGRISEAIQHYNESLRLKPDFAEAHCYLGLALSRAGRVPEAIAQYEAALRLKPDYAVARENLAALRVLPPAAPHP